MTRFCLSAFVVLMTAAGSLQAQSVLRSGASNRATSEVTLSYPRAAAAATPAMAAMPGMTPATPATPAAPAAGAAPTTPAPKPIVIRLDYGQPHLRGRALHTDSLVPYDKPWRMGANSSTTFTTDVDVVLGGATLSKGEYVLYTIPGRAGWKLVIQRSVGQPSMQFADSNDVARLDLRHATLPAPVESFTMWLIPSLEPGAAKGELRFAWGTDQLSTTWAIK